MTEPEPQSAADAARALSALGASKGGHARAESLTPERRSEIARNAAASRWGGNPEGERRRPRQEARYLRIPLPGGGDIQVTGHFPVTPANWDFFLSVLEAMKPGLVKDPGGESGG